MSGPTITPYWSYCVTVSSGEEQVLVPGASHGAPSPDGTKLAFLRGSFGELVIAAADGSGATPLVPANTADTVSWSPDSRSIAFGGYHGGLYTIRVDGSGPTLVARDARGGSSLPTGPLSPSAWVRSK